jgi:hypothetical protein
VDCIEDFIFHVQRDSILLAYSDLLSGHFVRASGQRRKVDSLRVPFSATAADDYPSLVESKG